MKNWKKKNFDGWNWPNSPNKRLKQKIVESKKKEGSYSYFKQIILPLLSGILLPFFSFVFLYSLTCSCAQQQQLTGGPRDTIPPLLIKELSTPNFQTNFEKQTIELAFNEFIEIRDVIKQVVVSPPLTYLPKVDRKKGFKSALFKFDEREVLKENITYAINFGESIRDLTEGNDVENLQFLFSTGDFIDSLKMTGFIADALTGNPVPDVLFMLYENFADTVVRTEKPYYFGKTDKDGNFTINYMKAGKFKGFALEDQDLNYLFNNPKERIGFTLDTITISDTDSIVKNIQIRLFEERTTLEKPRIDASSFGLIKIGFRRPPFDALIWQDSVGQELYSETDGDSIRIWYNLQDSTDWNIYVRRDTFVDTFAINTIPSNIYSLETEPPVNATEKKSINPFKPLTVSFNLPLKAVDTNYILLKEFSIRPATDSLQNSAKINKQADDSESIPTSEPSDSTLFVVSDSVQIIKDTSFVSLGKQIAASFTIDRDKKKKVVVQANWKEKQDYELIFFPGALTDWFGEKNTDTLSLSYTVQPKNEFGNINLTVTDLDTLQSYWFQLLLGESVMDQFAVKNAPVFKRSFTSLFPGKYSLKVIEDINGNGQWDPGNYDKKQQPEKISIAQLEELRAGWDVEAEVIIDFNDIIQEK